MNSTLIWTKTYGQVLLTARQTYITNRYSFRVLLHLSHVRFILQSCRACLITTMATRWQICGCYLKLLSRAFPCQKGKRYPGTHRFSQVSTVLVKEWPTCGLNCEFTGEDPKPCRSHVPGLQTEGIARGKHLAFRDSLLFPRRTPKASINHLFHHLLMIYYALHLYFHYVSYSP